MPFQHLRYFSILITLSLLSLGCQTQEDIRSLQDELSVLQLRANNLESRITQLESASESAIAFDPSSVEGYQRLETNNGSFLVAIDEIERHLDGYKVKLRVGNPANMTYNGVSIKFQWGERLQMNESDGFDSFTAWRNSLQEKEVALSDELKPGYWNPVQVTLAPAKPAEFGYVELSMTTNSVSLYTPSE